MPSKQINDFFSKRKQEKNELVAKPPGAEADPDSLPGSEEMVPTRVEDFLAEAAQLAHENTRKKHTKSHAARAILMSPNHTFRSIVA